MGYNKIRVYLRQTSHNRDNPNRPPWFDYQKTFKNLLDVTDWARTSLVVCLDGDDPAHFTYKYIKDWNYEVRPIDTTPRITSTIDGSNASQTLTCHEIYKDYQKGLIDEQTIIYLLENDYLHIPMWDAATLDLFNLIKNNIYASLYAHPDLWMFTEKEATEHWGMYKDLKSKIFVTNYSYWRTVPSITSSYLTDSKTFREDIDLFLQGKADNTSCEILTNKGRNIVSPIPGFSTHVQLPFVSPFIPWERISDETSI